MLVEYVESKTMIIKAIQLKDFRIYQGLNSIDLSSTDEKNIFIISGRNGFGKTTFLMSLVWCLYGRQMGDVDELYQKEISDQGGYSKYIANSLNRYASSHNVEDFHVAITITNAIIPELPCQEIKIQRTYNKRTGDTIQIFIDGLENELVKGLGDEKFPGEEIFIREYLMPIEIAKFFFFDAEKIVTLAEANTVEQRRKLSKAYSEILGIKKYQDIKENWEEIRTELNQSTASVKEQTALNTLRADIDNIDLEIAAKERTKADYRDKRDEKRLEASKLQEKLIRAGHSISTNELERLKVDEAELQGDIDLLQDDLKNHYELVPFAIAGGKLLEVIKQLDGEANYRNAQFKQDEIQEASNRVLTDLLVAQRSFPKVITNDVHEFYTNTFKQLIRKHFFTDAPETSSDFKSIHEFSDIERNEVLGVANQLKLSFRESFGRVSNGLTKARQEIATIRRRLKAAEANEEDPILAADRIRKEQLERDVNRLEIDMEFIVREIGQLEEQQKVKQRQYSEQAKKLKVSDTNRDKDARLTRVINKVGRFIVQFQEDKKRSLEDTILNSLTTLMHKKNFIRKVEVDIIGEDIDINLKDERGNLIQKDGLSKGEQQMYATALLRGLVEESRMDFPVFIDSPMQKFDEQHAENIVRHFYPTIADQVIIFPLINKEMNRREYEMLLPNVARTYLIHNVHADQSEFVEAKPSQFFETYNRLYNS